MLTMCTSEHEPETTVPSGGTFPRKKSFLPLLPSEQTSICPGETNLRPSSDRNQCQPWHFFKEDESVSNGLVHDHPIALRHIVWRLRMQYRYGPTDKQAGTASGQLGHGQSKLASSIKHGASAMRLPIRPQPTRTTRTLTPTTHNLPRWLATRPLDRHRPIHQAACPHICTPPIHRWV
jgi:hypothetical protein